MNRFVVLVYYCQMKRGIAPTILLIDVCPAQHQDLDQRIVIIYRSNLQTIEPILLFDWLIDREALL